jgi:hypothetical protein
MKFVIRACVVLGFLCGVSSLSQAMPVNYHFQGKVIYDGGSPIDQILPFWGDLSFDLTQASFITSPTTTPLSRDTCSAGPFFCVLEFVPGSSNDRLSISLLTAAIGPIVTRLDFPAGTFGSLGTFSFNTTGYISSGPYPAQTLATFPQTLTISSSATVPEPDGSTLVIIGLALVGYFRGRPRFFKCNRKTG